MSQSNLTRRRAIRATLTATVLISAGAGLGRAEGGFPNRAVKLINGFGAGGPTDIVARMLAGELSRAFRQNVVVENQSGASGNIATQALASAAADGYTYLVGATPLAVNEALLPDFPIRLGRDIVPVAAVGATANVLVVRPSLGVRSFAEFLQLARSKRHAVSYATVGLGSASHLAGVALDLRAHTQMLAVNYHDNGDALKDLLGGSVDARFASIPAVLGAVRDGRLVALATTGPQRSPFLPDLPTIAESGFPDYDIRLWIGVFARNGIPEEPLRAMETAISRAMASGDAASVLARQGIAPLSMSRDAFGAFVAKQIEGAKALVAAFNNDDAP